MNDIPLTDPDREHPNEYSEVEYPMLSQLAVMGWDYLQGDLDYPQKTFREHFREVILKPRLRAAIRKINLDDNGNEYLDDVTIDRAIQELQRTETQNLLDRNKELTEKLVLGVKVPWAECPAGALALLGAQMAVADVMRVVRRDAPYYAATGGGMTLSGGEPLMQMDFALALLDAARREGVASAVETSCAMPPMEFARVVGRADLYLCDIKASRAAYPALVGADPDIVLANIGALDKAGCEIVIRVPCVEGANFNEGLAAFVAEAAALEHVRGVDLLPYHDMGRGKAAMAGLAEPDWSAMRTPAPDAIKRFEERIGRASFHPVHEFA